VANITDSFEGWFTGSQANVQPAKAIDSSNVADWLNYAFLENGGPGTTSPLVNSLRGLRILGPGNQMAPRPDDTIGLVFINRPLMNLSDENVKKHPQLLPLLNPNPNTLGAYVKGLLDPTWGRANSGAIGNMLDPTFPWIAPFTNYMKTCSGFPDVQLNVSTSTPGIRKEVYQFVDGILKVNYNYDMRLSFHTFKPNILPFIFDVINHYIEGVTLGDEGLEPYPEALVGNWRDYDMRIYVTIMNKNFRNIEGIYCCGYGWFNSFPSGAFSAVDRTQGTLRGQGQDELDVNFPAVGFRYNNLRVADQFNRTTLFFCENMSPSKRAGFFRKLSVVEYMDGAYKSYPWINLNTMEMEYWSPL
jgi:hypothetical protein